MLLITNVNSSFLPNGKVNSGSNQKTNARYVFLPSLLSFSSSHHLNGS